ncbi:MAG: glucose-6-phosphate dehydrogenase [Verrucomicrobia bacterium TMED56]|jgi:glucose-6-phosphate 1-dehydrogenase|nr:MAG: glucose-6-phosphate dehydrogenase [Verrucomicrobia bacterium TMED56]
MRQLISQSLGNPPPTILVIFGASGDLTARKLAPAIFNLAEDDLLPEKCFLLGVGRTPMSDNAFREYLSDSLKNFSRRAISKKSWEKLEANIRFHSGSYDDLESFHSLERTILEMEKSLGRPSQCLFYISTPPSVFEPILENLGESGLAKRHHGSDCESKVIIEKPFGKDLASAKKLNEVINLRFNESQVFRIDHYLGKETVQSLLVQRFANSIFEPIWNRNYVSCVQITVSEELGVGKRGGYYDKSGALRDMIQNHVMQLLALTAMEPPSSLNPEAIRDEKVKALNAIKPLDLKGDSSEVVRGVYSEGLVKGEKALGYLSESGIPDDSITETYAALCLNIENWRWKGVPFYLRSGKRLALKASEIAVQFKRPPGILFGQDERFSLAPNLLVIRIQPNEGITLYLNSKTPGLETKLQPIELSFGYETTFGSNTPEAYERLILDALNGDGTLFIRGDEAEISWGLLSPILDFWSEQDSRGLENYSAGTWGPVAADKLLLARGHEWITGKDYK